MTLGVDPGRTGAAVELADDGRTALRVWTWQDQDVPPRLDLPVVLTAVEAQHVGRGRASSLALATWTGRLLEQVRGELLRPHPATWRAAVLGVGRLRRADAKSAARRACEIYALGEGLPTDDACEAWCLARYAWGVSRRPGAPRPTGR